MGMRAKAPEVKRSQNDIQLARAAEDKWRLYEAHGRDAEDFYNKASRRDTAGVLRGRANADVMQAQGDAIGESIRANRGSATGLGQAFATTAAARTRGQTDATRQADAMRIGQRADYLKMGSGLAADSQQAMASLARSQNQEAIAMAQAQTSANISKQRMLGQVAGAAMEGYGIRRQGQKAAARSRELQSAYEDALQEARAGSSYSSTPRWMTKG